MESEFTTVFWFVLLTQSFIFGFACSYLAGQKGKDNLIWFFIGFLLSFVGLIIIGFAKDETKPDTTQGQEQNLKTKIKIETLNPSVDLEAPVEVIGTTIKIAEKTEEVSLIIGFNNLSEKEISAVNFNILCFDSFGQPVKDSAGHIVNKIIQDEQVKPHTTFGTNKQYLLKEQPSTRKTEIVIQKVLYSDGTIWEKGDNKLITPNIENIADQEELDLLKKIAGTDAITYPSEHEDHWLCVCGRANKIEDASCVSCNRIREKVFNEFNQGQILKLKDEMKQQAILEQEEKKRQEDEKKRQENEKLKQKVERRIKTKRIAKIAISALAIIALIATSFHYIYSQIRERGAYKKAQTVYASAQKSNDKGKYFQSMGLFLRSGNFKDGRKQYNLIQRKLQNISDGSNHSLILKNDGTVAASGNIEGKSNVTGWNDIVAVSAGFKHSLGLKRDGTVVAIGNNECSQCNVSSWKDIVAISVGCWHSLGLKNDGTVVAVGNNEYSQCNVSGWKDIVAISVGCWHNLGLKNDGTVVATGDNGLGQCNVSGWKDIMAISVGDYHSLGLKKDGTVLATGDNGGDKCDVTGWKDIAGISAGSNHSLGLKRDGTVVAVGSNYYGQCDVSKWKDIVAVSAGSNHSLGLKRDGTVVAVGNNGNGQCDFVLKTGSQQKVHQNDIDSAELDNTVSKKPTTNNDIKKKSEIPTLGQIKLGDSRKKVEEVLGNNYLETFEELGPVYEEAYYLLNFNDEITVAIGEESQEVLEVISYSNKFETNLGAKVGDSYQSIEEQRDLFTMLL